MLKWYWLIEYLILPVMSLVCSGTYKKPRVGHCSRRPWGHLGKRNQDKWRIGLPPWKSSKLEILQSRSLYWWWVLCELVHSRNQGLVIAVEDSEVIEGKKSRLWRQRLQSWASPKWRFFSLDPFTGDESCVYWYIQETKGWSLQLRRLWGHRGQRNQDNVKKWTPIVKII